MKKYPVLLPAIHSFCILLMSHTVFAQIKPMPDSVGTALEAFIDNYAPSDSAFWRVQGLASYSINVGNWDNAIAIYRKYEPKFPPRKNEFEKIINILEAPKEKIEIKNLGQGINSALPEYGAVITADNKKLYFARNYGREKSNEDVMVSEYIDGKWGDAVGLGSPINTKSSEDPLSISADGNRLILYGSYPGSFGSGDIFYSDKKSDGSWGDVQHFPRPINTQYFDADCCITSDGNAMLFVSDRPGGNGEFRRKDDAQHIRGNTDIYVSIKQGDGSWEAPINLGPTINTPWSERTPFLHPDGKTLYFSSNGHPGLGSLDIFKSTKLNDNSWTEWSEPVNLGKEINNANENWAFVISTDGKLGYFSNERATGYGGSDIYSIEIPESMKPLPVITISGNVADENGVPLSASIKWEDLESGRNVGSLASNPKTGNYFIVLPLNKNYGYYAEKEGYYPVSKNIDLRSKINSESYTQNIIMASIESMREKGMPVRLNNLFFDFDKADLKPESYPELGRLSDILRQNSSMGIEISGHTDNKGTSQYNFELSRKRAEAVQDYLKFSLRLSNKIVAKGFGSSLPIAANDSEEGRALNRRVEIRFLK